MDRLKAIRWFVASAIFLLAAFAFALCLATLSARPVTFPRDPVTGLGMDWIFWGVGAVSVFVVLACIWSRSAPMQLALLLWFSLYFILWRFGWLWLGVVHPGVYFTELAPAFHLPPVWMYALVAMLVLYLFLLSGGLLVWNRIASRHEIKILCSKCGGHIVFSETNLGQQTPCPHCRSLIKLRLPGSLKMSCFFCQGHIEFPSHAMGKKMPCPHCQKDITLVEPK